MNLSGNAVRFWLQKLDIPVENLMVICDDINLPFGTTRLRKAGSDGGHNGLKHIQEVLETQQFARLRIGVGHEFGPGGQIDFVLGEISSEQKEMMPDLGLKVRSGIKTWALAGIDKAMNEVNSKQKINANIGID